MVSNLNQAYYSSSCFACSFVCFPYPQMQGVHLSSHSWQIILPPSQWKGTIRQQSTQLPTTKSTHCCLHPTSPPSHMLQWNWYLWLIFYLCCRSYALPPLPELLSIISFSHLHLLLDNSFPTSLKYNQVCSIKNKQIQKPDFMSCGRLIAEKMAPILHPYQCALWRDFAILLIKR